MRLYNNKYNIGKMITVLVLGSLRQTKQCRREHSYINSLPEVFAEVNLIKQWETFTFYLSLFFDWG